MAWMSPASATQRSLAIITPHESDLTWDEEN